MTMDVNVKQLKKNAFRQSKVRGETASRVRVPGGLVSAKSMARIVEIAEEFGQGEIFLTNRQGVKILSKYNQSLFHLFQLLNEKSYFLFIAGIIYICNINK